MTRHGFGFGLAALPPERPMHWWWGESGQQYLFSVFGADEIYDFEEIVYLLGRARYDGLYDPLYIGQSGHGGERLRQHEKLAAARRLGLTHIHVHFVSDSAQRFSVETDLRRRHRPPLNEQLVPATGFGALNSLSPSSPFGFGALSKFASPAPSANSLLPNHVSALAALLLSPSGK